MQGLIPAQRPWMAGMLAVLLGGCSGGSADAPRPVPVDTTVATVRAFADEVVTISTLEADEAVELAAQAGGRIQQLRVRQGDRVAPGQLLVVLDQVQLQAEVASLRAAQAKDRLNYERFDYLVKAGAASAIQRDELRQAYISSQAALKAREADLAFRDLRSPIGGTIGDLQVKQGDVIRAGDPFTTVIRNGRLLARIDLPARFRNRVRTGMAVLLEEPDSSRPLARGVVVSIDPSVKAGSQVLLLKAGFSNADGQLRNGLRVRTRVLLGQQEQLAVPFSSVTQASGQSYVYRLGSRQELEQNPGPLPLQRLRQLPGDARFALQTRVQLGPLQNGRYPVLGGLRPGTPVITSNLLNLRHGQPVNPAGPAEPATPSP
ncbi:MAG: hypothetical protein RLZZ468_1013 [Cyanobacteriota bacterium]